jgi:biotin-(acetyl-CoA carboxylase) ligase
MVHQSISYSEICQLVDFRGYRDTISVFLIGVSQNWTHKWPIWPKKTLGGCKVGGILARAVPFNGRLEGIIVGIGINVNTSKEELDRMLGPFFGYLQIQYSVLI